MATKQDKQEINNITAQSSKNLEIRLPQVAPSELATEEKPTKVKISRLNTAEVKEDHLQETLNKISSLAQETENKKSESEIRKIEIEKKLDYLRGELNRSSAFLQTTQKTIKNINLMYHNDMARLGNRIDTGKGIARTEEDLNHYYEHIQEKVKNLRSRVAAYKQQHSEHDLSKNFEQTVNEIISSFTDIENGGDKQSKDD